MFTSSQIRQIFLDFFQKKGHQLISSSSLIPADQTVLFTSAGMQQFIPYLSGEVKPSYQRACSIQKCFRTSDITNVGDKFHHTFFEMLGNWSFNDYFKEEAIILALDLLTNYFHLSIDRLWITVFRGEGEIAGDQLAKQIWQRHGIPVEHIKKFGMTDNFWGPVGTSGPCGPCSEIHYDCGAGACQKECDLPHCGPNCHCGRFVEIWNLVFMEYFCSPDKKYTSLKVKNIDTGAGLERLTTILQNKQSDYQTDLWKPIMDKINELAIIDYSINPYTHRIIADHSRAIVFLIADGVLPDKEGRGYVLRRLIRRLIRYARSIELTNQAIFVLIQIIVKQFSTIYPELRQQQEEIQVVVEKEISKFKRALEKGLKQFNQIVQQLVSQKKNRLSGEQVFHLYDTYGFPLEMTKELAQEKNMIIDEIGFKKEIKKHQQVSRAGAKKKFGGLGIATITDKTIKYKMLCLHTATHLLQQSLRTILGNEVRQMGSDINGDRLRFDFSYPNKLTEKQKHKVVELVNQQIKNNLSVVTKEMSYQKAIESGALGFFKEKYPTEVKVYSIGQFSQEICAGPHVQQTSELGKFKIISEKSSGAGVRRIKAILE